MLNELITSIFSGGVTGLLGAVITKYSEYKTKQLDIERTKLQHLHEAAMKELDAAIMEKEFASRVRVAEIEGESAIEISADDAFAKSYDVEPQRYSSPKSTIAQNWALVVLDFIRGFVRPGLTIYLCVVVTLMYMQARHSAMTTEIAMKIVETVLYLSTTCVLWWFGIRSRSK